MVFVNQSNGCASLPFESTYYQCVVIATQVDYKCVGHVDKFWQVEYRCTFSPCFFSACCSIFLVSSFGGNGNVILDDGGMMLTWLSMPSLVDGASVEVRGSLLDVSFTWLLLSGVSVF